MKQDNAYNSRVDKGWNMMHDILEAEMPTKIEDNRRIFFWFLLAGIGVCFLASQLLFNQSDKPSDQKIEDLSSSNVMALNETDDQNTKHSLIVNNDTDNQKTALSGKSKNAQIKVKENKSKPVSNNAFASQRKKELASVDKIHQENKLEFNSIKETELVQDLSTGITIDSKEANDILIYNPKNDLISNDPFLNDEIISVDNMISANDFTNSMTILSLPFEIKSINATSVSYHHDIPQLEIYYNEGRIKPIIKPSPFFVAVSAHGTLANPLGYKGWNTGLHVGIKKNRMSYSLLGRFGCLQRSLVDQTTMLQDPANPEIDLTNMFDTMGVETKTIEESIKEKLYFIETGISLDYNLGKGIYVNLTPGIDFMFRNQTTVDAMDVTAGSNNPMPVVENFYQSTIIAQSVVPFISAGVSYNIFNGLYLSAYYKRQLSASVERPNSLISLNQFNAGLKFEF